MARHFVIYDEKETLGGKMCLTLNVKKRLCLLFKKKCSTLEKSNKAWYSWNLTSPNTMLAFEICKTYLKMILKVWEESVSNIFNTLFHKLNETFRGCIIANIWASQLHFIFQRYIFLDSPTFPTLVVLHYDISMWMDFCSKIYLFCSRYCLRSQQ